MESSGTERSITGLGVSISGSIFLREIRIVSGALFNGTEASVPIREKIISAFTKFIAWIERFSVKFQTSVRKKTLSCLSLMRGKFEER